MNDKFVMKERKEVKEWEKILFYELNDKFVMKERKKMKEWEKIPFLIFFSPWLLLEYVKWTVVYYEREKGNERVREDSFSNFLFIVSFVGICKVDSNNISSLGNRRGQQ